MPTASAWPWAAPASGFGGRLPTTSPALGSIPVARNYAGVADENAGHKVDGSFRVTDVAITSNPAQDEDGYRVGEKIEVTHDVQHRGLCASATPSWPSGSGTPTTAPTTGRRNTSPAPGRSELIYRYRVQLTDFDADGISVDVGGPPSGFGERVPTTSPELGSVPVSRNYSGVPDDAGHKVDGAVTVAFGAPAFVVSEDGDHGGRDRGAGRRSPPRGDHPDFTATPEGGATPSDYSVAPASLVFAPGETRHSVTVTALDDGEVDGGESLRLSFGTLPPGIRAGVQDSAFVVIDDNDGLEPVVSIADVDGGSGPGSVGFTVAADRSQRPRHHGGLGHRRQRRGPGRRLRGDRHPSPSWLARRPQRSACRPADCRAATMRPIPPDRPFSVTLSNPVNAVFSAGVDTIEAQSSWSGRRRWSSRRRRSWRRLRTPPAT